jgi:predicted nucleic acid-binding protein
MSESFADSNICVYAFDKSDTRKQEIAFSILNQTPVLSSQVLIETYNACFRKLKLSAEVCEAHILILTDIIQLFKIDEKVFHKAFAVQHRFGFSFP